MSDLGIVPDGSILIDGPLVNQAGSTRRLVNLSASRGAVEIDASGCVVLPGFVDPSIELFSDNYTAAFVTRMATSLMAAGTTTFRCGPAPRKAASLWESVKRAFPDSLAGAELNPLVPLLFPIPVFTQRGDGGARPNGDNVPLAMGTAFHQPQQPVFSMQMAISLACLHLGLTIEQAIVAATTNAAHAIGLGQHLGSIEPGKQADLLILAVPDYREIPYHLGGNLVRMVIKKGRKVIERGAKS
jgi:imidazolonepropionase-like amidohydrolase